MSIGDDLAEKRPGLWDRVKMGWSARAGRREYWLWVGMLTALGLIPGIGSAAVGLWILAYARRLHDLGRSGWWSLAPVGLAFMIGGAGVVIGVNLSVSILIAGVSSWVFNIWLGCQRGDEGTNRFGPPPASDWRTLMVGRPKPR